MKLRIFALFLIFAVSTWLPYAAQQSAQPQPAAQSQSSAGAPAPGKEAANPACACCDPAKHDSTSAASDQPAACCHGQKHNAALVNCCNAKSALASSPNDGKSCCAGNGKPCCNAKDDKPCCSNGAVGGNSKDKKLCCAGHCGAPAHAK